MADNTTLNAGSGGDTVAMDDVSGVKHQRVKIEYGTDGNATDVSDSNPLPVDDAGGSITVDAAELTTLAGAVAGSEMQVDVVTSALPSGAATSAKQDTQTTHLATLAGAVGGTEVQVDVVSSALPSGAATSAKQPALGTAGSASADVLSVQGVASMTALKVDGSAVTQPVSGTVGVSGTVAVTDNSGSLTIDAPVGTPAFVRLSDGSSAISTLPVSLASVPSHAVTNAGTFAVQVDGAALTSLQLLDDVVATLGTDTYTEATSKGLTIGAVRRDADTTLVNTTNEIGPLQMDANGRLKVEAFSGETLPVSLTSTTITGTVAVTQSGTWDEIGINDSGNSITVDNGGTFVTQENGAALTALQLIDDPVAVLGTATYTEATSKGFIIGAVRRDADTTLVDTTNEFAPLQVDAAGKLKVEVFDGGDSHTVDNGGTFVVQENGAALTALQLIDDIVYTDDTSTHSTGSSKGALIMAAATPSDGSVNANDIGAVAMTTDRKLHVAVMDALPAGTAAIGKLAANSGVDIGDVDVTSISAGTNLIGNVGIGVRTSGGVTPFYSLDLDESEEDIKTSAGQVYFIHAMNLAATKRYLKFYNATAANVTVGTTTPVAVFALPTQGDTNGAGFTLAIPMGIAFSTAISAAVTTGFADNDTGAPGTNDCIVCVGYA